MYTEIQKIPTHTAPNLQLIHIWVRVQTASGAKSPRISGTLNGGTEPYKIYKAILSILGMGFPLHKPYIRLTYSLYR